MSDLYSAGVLSLGAPLTLDEAVARAAQLGAHPAGARRILKRASGPYVEVALRYAVDHPDADRLDALTPGLVHLLLADVVPAVAEAAGDGVAKRYTEDRPGLLEDAGCVYVITSSDARELRLSVLGPADRAPKPDGLYVSTAWAPDRAHLAKHDLRVEVRCFPPPGLAGALVPARGGHLATAALRPFLAIKKSLEVAGLAVIGTTPYAVSDLGGHVATLTLKEAKRLGKADPGDAKRKARSLRAKDGTLWIEWEDGGWTEVDPTTGARAPGPGPEPDAPVHGEPIEIGGRSFPRGRGQTHVLEPTPDPDTLLLATDTAHYLVHAPTRALTLRLPTKAGPRAWVEGKRPVLWVGPWATAYVFDLR
jgi:hypothetical protein